MSLIKDLIAKLSPATRPDFIAPLTPVTHELFTRVDGVPFVYKRDREYMKDGWHRFRWFPGSELVGKPTPDERKYGILGVFHDSEHEMQTWEIDSYLQLVRPSWRLIVLYRLGGQSWLCYPWNRGDAHQKGWGSGPVAVHLVGDTVEAFDIIYARGPVYNLIYQRQDGTVHVRNHLLLNLTAAEDIRANDNSEISDAFRIVRGRVLAQQRQEAEAQYRVQLTTTEGKIKYQLGFLGAELLAWRESGQDIVVEWKDGIHKYSSRIAANMQVTTAGICLSGKDGDFNLAAVVDVMREAHRRGRVVTVGPQGALTEERYRQVHPINQQGYPEYDDEFEDENDD